MSNIKWESDKPCAGCTTRPPVMAYGIPKRGGIMLCDECSRHLAFGMLRDIAEREVGTQTAKEIISLMEKRGFFGSFAGSMRLSEPTTFPQPRESFRNAQKAAAAAN